jgi:hypothetical protein
VSAPQWKRGCVLLVAACLLAAILACSLGAAGIWRGVVSPPWFDLALGVVRVVGYSTWNASCPPYEGCAPTRNEAYVIWLVLRRSDGAGQNPDAYQLIGLPIEHPP